MKLEFMKFLIYIVVVPTTLSVISVYLTIKFSKKHDLYDSVGGRKIHSGNVPRLGGLGFFTAFLISILIFHFRFPEMKIFSIEFFLILLASLSIFIMGILDDIRNWKAILKLILQSFAAVLVLLAGFRFTEINFAPIGFYWDLKLLSYPITFLWLIGITNAVNLLDGIDGQAGCLSASLLISYVVIFLEYGVNPTVSYISLILVFSIVGFLFFNLSRPSAKIFMGDGGSQLLGFILAFLPLMKNTYGTEAIKLPFAICFLMLPIFDVIAAVWRRIREKQPISHGDQFHVHHKLMLIGLSSRKTLIVFMMLQIIIDIFVVVAIIIQGYVAFFTLVGIILLGLLFFYLLHAEKEKIVKKGLKNSAQNNY